MNRRVVVLERTAYKPIVAPDGVEYDYGYAIRLCVTVDRWDARMKATLPFLAASAEIGQIQASWTMQVLGLAGSEISSAQVPPTELSVESFVLAKQSLAKLITAVNDPGTRFMASLLATIKPADKLDEELRMGAARAFALSRIARRLSLEDTLNRIGSSDAAVNGAIQDVYARLVGGGPADRPSDGASAKCRQLLGGIEADV